MKKYSAGFIFLQIVVMLFISWIIGLVCAIFLLKVDAPIPVSFILILPQILIWLMLYFPLINHVLAPAAGRTYAKKAAEEGFDDEYTYINKDTGTVGAIITVDVRSGRLAYVSFQNPFRFQIAQAREITGLKADLIKGPFGGTRYVYFQFSHRNRRFMFPTFTAKNPVAIGSTQIQDALAKGKRICAMIMMAHQAAINSAQAPAQAPQTAATDDNGTDK